MKTIGIVAEGPRDFELIAAVIDTITDEENNYQMIQPEPNMIGQFGNGWKGVWKWCEDNQGKLKAYMHSLTPVLDLLVVHMDGDVQRCEKEVHCVCQRALCDAPVETHPLTCKKIIGDKNACPVILPCEHHENTPDAGADFLRTFINTLLLPEDGLAVSYMIPFDATDTWIVAALDQYDDYEILPDPWGDIIAHALVYSWKENLSGFVLQWYRVGQNHIYSPVNFIQVFFHSALDFLRWLLIRPPTKSVQQPI